MGLGREQHHRGDGAGAGNQGDCEREGGDIGDEVFGDGSLRGLVLAHVGAVEHHFIGDGEQQEATGDAEGRRGDAEQPEEGFAGDGEEGKHAEADHAGTPADRMLLLLVHAAGDTQEDRTEAGRIDHHQQGDECSGQIVQN